MRTRTWAAGTVAVLVVASVVGIATAAAGRCAVGGDPGPGAAVWTPSGGPEERAAADEAQRRTAAVTAAAGLPATVVWGLRSREGNGEQLPEVVGATVTDDGVLVTVQVRGDDALLAAHAAADGRPLWSAALPDRRGGVVLDPVPGGPLLVTTNQALAALDPSTGELRWCTGVDPDATSTATPTGDGVLVAEQDARRSRMRMLSTGTGDEQWSERYESHDGGIAPVVAGDTVAVFAADAGDDGRTSGVRAFRTATGEPAWSSTVDFPKPMGASDGVLLLRTDAGLQGVDPGTGRVYWTSREPVGGGTRGGGTVVAPPVAGAPALLLRAVGQDDSRGGLTGFDPATGVVRWERTGEELGGRPGRPVESPGALGDRVLLTDHDLLAVVDARDGRVLGRGTVRGVDVVSGDLGVAFGGPLTTVLRFAP
ncbi:PQQ-binding-like beta-propeller repeat protein [Pseudonocardia nematodicida]|uniref:PQQ-binding-like beta-propeller repeat protein n=1 Tax=Pseudonocardia nematodicida TaxID=1206997 RepID=A0ABV1K770_9PSEU